MKRQSTVLINRTSKGKFLVVEQCGGSLLWFHWMEGRCWFVKLISCLYMDKNRKNNIWWHHLSRVVDRHCFDVDPDPDRTFHFVTHPRSGTRSYPKLTHVGKSDFVNTFLRYLLQCQFIVFLTVVRLLKLAEKRSSFVFTFGWNGSWMPISDLIRGPPPPPELVQHFVYRGSTIHIGARALHVLNLIWFWQ